MKLLKSGILLFMVSFSAADISSDFGLVEVQYGEKKVKFGEEWTPTEVVNVPKINYMADDETYYTLIMTDPDASSGNPEFLHWLVANIHGSDFSEGDNFNRNIWASYVGSRPPQGSGLHRYFFLVYKQPGEINFNNYPLDRQEFSTKEMVEKYQLGDLIAGNMFQAQWDESVPK